jgi:two-component system alkaline phosphatase synthesis response regulator PhoP
MAKTLLLVDDDLHILETAKDILEASGYDVLTAESGAEARRQLAAGPCALAIIDFNLKDITGVDLAVALKQTRPDLIVFLMTGEANVDLGAAKPAVREVLTKPVNPTELIALLQKVI